MKYLLILILYFLPVLAYAQDYKPLFNKLSEMSEQGDIEAAYHLGMLFNNGIGTSRNLEQAYKWFKLSGEASDPLGAYKLGCYFGGQAGDVVEYDAEKSLQYKLVAADAGYSYAQFDVALAYLGRGDIEHAMEYVTKSAHQGYYNAFQLLATLNYQGDVIPRNLIKTYSFTLLYMRMMPDMSKSQIADFLKEIEKEITHKQIKRGIENADKWHINKTSLTLKANSGLERSYEITGLPLP